MWSRERQIQNYEDYGNSFISWKMSADRLLVASNVLKHQRDENKIDKDGIPYLVTILFPELMLRGFAAEYLLKSIWLKNGGSFVSNGEYQGISGAKDHNLLNLADVNKVIFTKTQRDVLNRLSLIMVSSGRYPISKKWSDNLIKSQHGGGKGASSFWRTPSDDKTFENILNVLYKNLE